MYVWCMCVLVTVSLRIIVFCEWGGGGGRGEFHRIGIPFYVDEDDEAVYGVCVFLLPKT